MIDLNRLLDDPTSIPVIGDGRIVAGNRELTADVIEARAEASSRPCRRAVDGVLEGFCRRGVRPVLVSMHGFFNPIFTKAMHPWHIGVLWDRDPRMAVRFMKKLKDRWGPCIGDNLPYSARDPYTHTADDHAARVGLPHLAMEIRHDLIETPEGAELWSRRIGDVLAETLADSHLCRIEQLP